MARQSEYRSVSITVRGRICRSEPAGSGRGVFRRLPTVLAVFTLLAASACSDSGEEDSGAQEPAPEYLSTYEAEEPGGDSSLLSGELVVDFDCLYVESDDLDERQIPLFPAGEVSSAEEGEGFHYQGSDFRDGDHIDLDGGGSGDLAGAMELYDHVLAPETCVESTTAFWIAAQ